MSQKRGAKGAIGTEALNRLKDRGESSGAQRHAKEGDLARSDAWYSEAD
ncbi:hypothetical protein M0R72_12060 [Candidatus Pacearchaeota archaeon]|jgi:hypothetical protein|nr:hypothetical protein [Candidatus Pacearchaeota archaeon]